MLTISLRDYMHRVQNLQVPDSPGLPDSVLGYHVDLVGLPVGYPRATVGQRCQFVRFTHESYGFSRTKQSLRIY